MENSERVSKILERLNNEYPDLNGTDLNYETPVQLLVATILSAQSTDKIVNRITSELFKKYKTAADFANIEAGELEDLVYSSGYYRNKSKWIHESCKILVEEFNSEIPKNIEKLTTLPGVGRKTANIVLSEAFGIRQGIAVDTHVMRLVKRLGFSNMKRREKIEKDLMELLPSDSWYEFSNLLIAHGREICKSVKPKCEECVISEYCPSAFSFE